MVDCLKSRYSDNGPDSRIVGQWKYSWGEALESITDHAEQKKPPHGCGGWDHHYTFPISHDAACRPELHGGELVGIGIPAWQCLSKSSTPTDTRYKGRLLKNDIGNITWPRSRKESYYAWIDLFGVKSIRMVANESTDWTKNSILHLTK